MSLNAYTSTDEKTGLAVLPSVSRHTNGDGGTTCSGRRWRGVCARGRPNTPRTVTSRVTDGRIVARRTCFVYIYIFFYFRKRASRNRLSLFFFVFFFFFVSTAIRANPVLQLCTSRQSNEHYIITRNIVGRHDDRTLTIYT